MIDRYALADEMGEMRRLAAEKWAADPLPNGPEATAALQGNIAKFGLEANIAQLETDGYTVLPPGKAGPLELIERIKAAMLEIEQRVSTDNLGDQSGLGTTLFHMLPEDRAFEEALMSEVALTLVTYLLGYRAKLSQCTGLIKGKGTPALGLHADHSGKFAAPWSMQANYSVVTWVLTDYTRDNGAVCVWPGSHRWGRPVPPDMMMAHDHEEIRVLEIPAGSMIIWHGSTWHGAVPRVSDDRRMTLVLPHVRDAIQPQELFWASVTPEMIERNPARFCTLMGLTSAGPWLQDGPDPTRIAMGPVSGSQFD
ncbi:MAG: phytanoyl-CoA dioxygenase family protein [Pseudomonadota bacterium]|nr:phytanoyl-CoA dioxygenase family protein [Pseudomonadota bacterium]